MKKLMISLKKHRSAVSAVALVLVVAAIFWVVNSPAVVGAAASKRVLPIYSVQRSDKTVAISFDAAWGNEDTQQLIDTLNKYKVNATFFVVGDWVDKYPESVKALADAGNEVMNHSKDHAHFSKLSAEEIKTNVNACNDKIEAITGVRPTLFRCPYGEYNDTVVSTVNSMGMNTIQWSIDSLDWKDLSASEITSRVLDGMKPGSIVLFHNAAKNTPEALPGILEALQKQGYTIVPISKLLLTGDYAIDNTGCQCPVASGQTAPGASAVPQTAAPSDKGTSKPSAATDTQTPASAAPAKTQAPKVVTPAAQSPSPTKTQTPKTTPAPSQAPKTAAPSKSA